MAPPAQPQKSAAENADALVRKEVARILKGPVAERMAQLIPPLASHTDPFRTVMESPELLQACIMLFKAKRDLFKEFLVDEAGNPVARDDVRVKCGRSVDEVIGMAVRQGMRSYAELYFGDPVTPPKTPQPPKAPAAVKPPPKGWFKLIDVEKTGQKFSDHYGQEKLMPKNMTKSGRFYGAIKDALDYEWQVRFFPIYVRIPSHVFDKLGIGITRMDTEERLQRLAELAMADINKAESVIRDPLLFREMIDNNVLAADTVSSLGASGFKGINEALGGLDPKQKWDVFANRETALKLYEDKRITAQDIEALADYLHVLNEYALDAIFDLKLNRDQMQLFVKTAEQQLGAKLFMALFGPVQQIIPDEQEEQIKLRKYQAFTQSALRSMVTAVKQLDDNLRRTGGEGAIGECLATVCRTRRPDLEKELKKLAPANAAA
jgi:hypothetical protein